MDDPAVFTDFVINTLGFTTHQMIDVITNFVKSFWDLLAGKYGDIDTFAKDTHYTNNTRSAMQRILIRNNINQGLKYMFFEIKNREL